MPIVEVHMRNNGFQPKLREMEDSTPATPQRRCMIGGAVQTDAVTISDALMIVQIILAIHTRGIPLDNA